MSNIINVSDEALSKLKSTLIDSGTSYKQNLLRLRSLMEEITSGDIQGTVATELLSKFQQKEAVFQGIINTIEDAEEYTGVKARKFNDMLGSLKSNMK